MQKIKKSIKKIVSTSVIGLAMIAAGAFVLAPIAGAATTPLKCSILPSDICNAANQPANTSQTQDISKNAIFVMLRIVLQIMTAGVGVAAVGGIVYAAVLYTSAGDAADQVKKAKTIITDVVIGLVAYALMFLLLNWLIPGGVFTT